MRAEEKSRILHLVAPLLLRQDGAATASGRDSPTSRPPLARGRDHITNLKTWGQTWHRPGDSEKDRDGGDTLGRKTAKECANGCAALLCLYSPSQRAAKPLPWGEVGHFCTGYSFLICRAPSRRFKHSSVHLRQHLGEPHPVRGGGQTNAAKI